MFVRTGSNEIQLAVVISDPNAPGDTVAAVAIGSILELRHKLGAIKCDPAIDFRNGYDAGTVPTTPEQRRRLCRWVQAGYTITLHTTASGEYRFGRVKREKLGMSDIDQLWLDNWIDAMDIEGERRQAQAKPAPRPEPLPQKPKRKRRKDRRALETRAHRDMW